MAKDGAGQIEIPLFVRGSGNDEYHIGDFGDANCQIDLQHYKIMVFKDKKNPLHRALILKPKGH